MDHEDLKDTIFFVCRFLVKKRGCSDNKITFPSRRLFLLSRIAITLRLLNTHLCPVIFILMKKWPFLLLFVIGAIAACNRENRELEKEREAVLYQKVGTWIDTCWNQRNFEVLDELTASQFTRHLNGVKVAQGNNELEAHLQLFFTAFPDLKISADEVYIKDQMAFLHWNAQGTNTGVFGEVGPTGKKVNINGLSHLFFSPNGKILKEIVYYNELELLQQLGYTLVPPNME